MLTTPQAVRLMLATLGHKGLIERRPHPGNKRVVQTFLTGEGRSVIVRCRVEVLEVERRLARNVDDEERRTVIQFLEKYLYGTEVR
jgi:DNA-binding MarR family transcriptional regulator